MRCLTSALLVAAASVAGPLPAQPGPQPAPSGVCQLIFEGTPQGRLNSVLQPSGKRNSYLGGGVVARCPEQNMTLIADSAEHFGDTETLRLINNVRYSEPRLTLTSDLLTYWMPEERFKAEGHVVTTLPTGTTMTGPTMDYYRAVPGIRGASRMVAPGRPTIDIAQRDSTGNPAPPVRVLANTVVIEADSLVYASGRVEITRTDLFATSDSAFMDDGSGFVRLMRQPVIEGRGDRHFVLSGTEIDVYSRQRQLERSVSKGSAKGVSEDVTLTGDTLDFRFADGGLSHIYAFGPGRGRAVSEAYDIVADSLDVDMAGQRMRELRAITSAFAQSTPDSAKIHSDAKDWMRGDTIFAFFDTAATAADSASEGQLSRLVARGNASSYYQLAPRDSAAVEPAVNYVRGRDITVSFANREVHTVTIVEQATGLYLEPGLPDPAPTDTTNTAAPAEPRPAPPRGQPPTSGARRP